MAPRTGAHGIAPVWLAALGLTACAGAPQQPDAAGTDAPPAAVAAAAAPENPYPGTTMRTGPDGATVYCRREIATGERIAKERCYTEHAMRQLETQRQDFEKSRETSTYSTSGMGSPPL